jgi:tripartite ATP-independent transporter DctM subunit
MFVTVLFILLAGLPVWAALATTGLLFVLIISPESMSIIPFKLFYGLDDFSLLAIPLFILMAAAISKTKASFDLYEALHKWLHWLPGGIGISNLVACSIMGALSGSAPAVAAAIGGVGLPEMKKRGYPDTMAAGIIAVGGTMGILIPPSITMILYGVATETSIGRLFIAGIIPGFIMTLLMAIWIGIYFYFRVIKRKRQEIKEAIPVDSSVSAANVPTEISYTWKDRSEISYTWRERFMSLPKIMPFLLLILLILGSLYGGYASPSEAAGVGAIMAIVLAAIIYKAYKPQIIKGILSQAVIDSSMILMIMVASLLFGFALSNAYATQAMAESLMGLPFGSWGILSVVLIFVTILGMFIPPAALILLVAPILLQILLSLDLGIEQVTIWFAVVMTFCMQIGLVSPLTGLNLYIVKRMKPELSVWQIFKGCVPFIIILLLGIVILSIFPELATWLPDQMMGEVVK